MSDNRAREGVQSADILAAERRILEEAGIFDSNWYRVAARLTSDESPADHYLREGWRRGLEPSSRFDGAWLYPFYRSIGLDGPPALTFVTLRAAGWPTYFTRKDAEQIAALIRDSSLFDAAAYRRRVPGLGDLDPALHYLIVGERSGLRPSDSFDPVYYAERYSDVTIDGFNCLAHFLLAGQQEKRVPLSVVSQLDFDLSRLDPERETIVLMIHQASRTGAPILAYNMALRLRERYNVVALILFDGELFAHFRECCAATIGPLKYEEWIPAEAERLAQSLLTSCRVSYAIANTIECRIFVPPFVAALVPVVTLIHEFVSYWPADALENCLNWSTEIVFSAEVTAAAARAKYPILVSRTVHLLPQGQSALPPGQAVAQEKEDEVRRIRDAMRPPDQEGAFVVLGCGTITHRKGVDLFLSCAAEVASLKTRRPVRFVWIGQVAKGDIEGEQYAATLSEQIAAGHVAMLNEVKNLEPAYAAADLFFLSSRLDPLPNVVIDATLRGMPIVCFEHTTGFSEFLDADPVGRQGLIPDLDVKLAAAVIARVADDDALAAAMGNAVKTKAQATFDMDRYVHAVDEMGRGAMRTMQQRAADLETIDNDPLFDPVIFDGLDVLSKSRREAIATYLARSAAYVLSRETTASFYNRRPCSGFHPQAYGHAHSARFDATIVNPLAHFIRSGKPDGPWKPDVVVPGDFNPDTADRTAIRVGLHAHFHYPELAADLLRKLASNRSPCDLLLSTTDETKAGVLRKATRRYRGGAVVIRVVPNRGRDIGAFLTAFHQDIVGRYDIIGHVHGKRSLSLGDSIVGERWREFLWQHLVGDLFPMADAITGHFARHEQCGIVFPEDPHLSGWDANLGNAEDLARRMGITEPLPPFFDFPIGTMFWARPQALAPLFGLNLAWEDYPEEPAPYDGTILHAIERMLPFAARKAGYNYTLTSVPGLTW